jgi:type IV pilus assembly protein PilV
MTRSNSFIRRNLSSNPGKQRGVAMLEVLIAFFVLSIGLLGLAGLQIKALQFNSGAYQRSQATVLAYDMLDRMRLNVSEAQGDNYNVASFSTTGSGAGMVGADLDQWFTAVTGNLPEGKGKIVCDANDICTVSVQWSDRFSATTGATEMVEISSQL